MLIIVMLITTVIIAIVMCCCCYCVLKLMNLVPSHVPPIIDMNISTPMRSNLPW